LLQLAQALRLFGVVHQDGAAVAHGPEILGWIEREPRNPRDVADGAALVLRGVGLARILDHDELVAGRDVHDRIEIGGVTVEVNRQDAARLRSDEALDALGVEVHRHGVHVTEDGDGAETRDRESRERRGHRRGDDLVTGADATGFEGEDESVGSVRDGDRVLHSHVGGEFLLERLHLGAEDEPAAIEDARDRAVDGRAVGRHLGAQVVEGNLQGVGHR
jgi:hypothetical protein